MLKLRFLNPTTKEEIFHKLPKSLVNSSQLFKTTKEWIERVKLENNKDRLLEVETISLPPEITTNRLLEWFKTYKQSLPENMDIDDFFGMDCEYDKAVYEMYYEVLSTQGFIYNSSNYVNTGIKELSKCAESLKLPVVVFSNRPTRWKKDLKHCIGVFGDNEHKEWTITRKQTDNHLVIGGTSISVIYPEFYSVLSHGSDKLKNLIKDGVFLIVDMRETDLEWKCAITREFFDWQITGNNCSALYILGDLEALNINMFTHRRYEEFKGNALKNLQTIEYINSVLPNTITNVEISSDLSKLSAKYGDEVLHNEFEMLQKYIKPSIINQDGVIVPNNIYIHLHGDYIQQMAFIVNRISFLEEVAAIYAPKYLEGTITDANKLSSSFSMVKIYKETGSFVVVDSGRFINNYRPTLNIASKTIHIVMA